MNDLAIGYYTWSQEITYNRETYKFEHGKGKDYIHTVGGKEYEPSKWMELVEKYIADNDLSDLLEQIMAYVKVNCLWVKHKDLKQYAADCLLHESYKSWNDFVLQEKLKL